MADSIVDFPHKRNYDHGRSVHFAAMKTSQCNVKHYDHEGCVARHELWYTKAEYEAMRLAVKEDVLKFVQRLRMVPHSITRETMMANQPRRAAGAVSGSSISSHRLAYLR